MITWENHRSLMADIIDAILSCRDIGEVMDLFTPQQASSFMNQQCWNPEVYHEYGDAYLKCVLPDGNVYERKLS